MSDVSNRRDFLLRSASTAAALAVTGTLGACGGSVDPAQFNYGVASGDPLSDRVILWTHAKIPNSSATTVWLTWQVANDSAFASVVRSGRVQATDAASFTVKVDVTGLAAGTSYFYRFVDDAGVASPVGTTRTRELTPM